MANVGSLYIAICCKFTNKMLSGRHGPACDEWRLGSDKKTWLTQWWWSGWHFKVMTSKWFRFEEAFI